MALNPDCIDDAFITFSHICPIMVVNVSLLNVRVGFSLFHLVHAEEYDDLRELNTATSNGWRK